MTDTASPDSVHRTWFRHHGEAGELFRIMLVNFALTVATLGIYRFWAKTRTRRYRWSQTSFLDDRLEYTGDGKELFLGFLIVIAVLTVAGATYQLAYLAALANAPGLTAALDVLLFAGVVMLIGVARFRARRYRLSRTRWRGIRGAQTGSAVEYGLRYLGYSLLALLTLGFYSPFMTTKLNGYKLNNTQFGNRPFRFDGSGRDLLKPFAIAWILFLPTLGASWFWYRAATLRYFVARTQYENLRFATNVRGGPLGWLYVSNGLLMIFTLGLAYAYVLVRTARFACDNLEVVGEQDFARIAQSAAAAPATGEGLAEVFDVGEF